jgi:hypothetical protein
VPDSFEHINADIYTGWDSKKRKLWYEDKGFLPCWSHTDYVMTAWKSKVHLGTMDPKMRIPAKQISIMMASLEIYKSHSDSE